MTREEFDASLGELGKTQAIRDIVLALSTISGALKPSEAFSAGVQGENEGLHAYLHVDGPKYRVRLTILPPDEVAAAE